jgi:phenylacetate-coenzyme A ligase PaaK-like adenylate-forming protein
MIQPATGDYEKDRQRHVAWASERVAAEIQRVTASLEDLWKLRDERLRTLVEHARKNSSWWAQRLEAVDVSTLSGRDLSMIPPMTKDDLMTNWDEIVCDPRLDLELANRHLEQIARSGAAYLLDEYHVIATGGSTGRRAVVVWDFEGWGMSFVTLQSRGLWLASLADTIPELPIKVASLMSVNPVHMGGAAAACFSNPDLTEMHRLSTSAPTSEIVARLEEIQPHALVGYPSVLHELALAKLRGALNIEIEGVHSGGEPLLPEARACIERAFGISVTNLWGVSETGYLASTCPGNEGLVIQEDSCVIEPVDSQNRAVPSGQRAAKALVTNLLNRVLPVIRYEVTDEFTLLEPLPDGPLHGRRVSDIQGRLDEAFRYVDGIFVHPHLFRSALTQLSDVAEYQVVQTVSGARVALVARGEIDLEALAKRLEGDLQTAGLSDARVVVSRVDRLGRHAHSGKLRRFVPLPER